MSELRAASRVLLAWAICASLWDSSVEARSHRKAKAEDVQQAAKLLSDGKAALQAKNSGQAKSLFEDAYRKNPSAEALFQLGKLADSEGRIVAAQDVMRRFLQETAGDEEGPDQKEATRIVQLAGPPSGEVNILGARGAARAHRDARAQRAPVDAGRAGAACRPVAHLAGRALS